MTENLDKSSHGNLSKMNLKDLMNLLLRKGYILEYQTPFKLGYLDINPEQFYFQFVIVLNNGERWIVHSTTSIRNDRVNIHQWNAFHL